MSIPTQQNPLRSYQVVSDSGFDPCQPPPWPDPVVDPYREYYQQQHFLHSTPYQQLYNYPPILRNTPSPNPPVTNPTSLPTSDPHHTPTLASKPVPTAATPPLLTSFLSLQTHSRYPLHPNPNLNTIDLNPTPNPITNPTVGSRRFTITDLTINITSIAASRMNGTSSEDAEASTAEAAPPLEWKFSQVFGERTAGEDVQEVDIISAIECDKSGDHLETGDRGGRVVLFERTDMREQASRKELEKSDNQVGRHPEFRYKTEFQSHEPESEFRYKTGLPPWSMFAYFESGYADGDDTVFGKFFDMIHELDIYKMFDKLLERNDRMIFEKYVFIFDPGGETIDAENDLEVRFVNGVSQLSDDDFKKKYKEFCSTFGRAIHFKICCAMALLLQGKMLKPRESLIALSTLHQVYSSQHQVHSMGLVNNLRPQSSFQQSLYIGTSQIAYHLAITSRISTCSYDALDEETAKVANNQHLYDNIEAQYKGSTTNQLCSCSYSRPWGQGRFQGVESCYVPKCMDEQMKTK